MGRRVVSAAQLGPALRQYTEKELPKYVALIHQKVHVQAANLLAQDTPVGNPDLWESPPPPGYVGGRARGGWQSTVGAPAVSENNRIDPSGDSVSGEAKATAQRIRAGDRSFVTNHVPYIQRLNDGWSKQQPAGFVQRTQDRLRRQFG